MTDKLLTPILKPHGYVRLYTICCGSQFGGKRYRVAFAKPRAKIAVEYGRPDVVKAATLKKLGWRVFWVDHVETAHGQIRLARTPAAKRSSGGPRRQAATGSKRVQAR